MILDTSDYILVDPATLETAVGIGVCMTFLFTVTLALLCFSVWKIQKLQKKLSPEESS